MESVGGINRNALPSPRSMAGVEQQLGLGFDDRDDGDALALFLESQMMEGEGDLGSSSEEEMPPSKRCRVSAEQCPDEQGGIESGAFANIPPEIFPKILKFLSSEDLSSCAKVCHYLRLVASDEPLWKRLYLLRWGALKSSKKSLTWKQLYFERDRADVTESLKNSPSEFKQYYLQMQVSKRGEAPPRKATDELWVVDEPVVDDAVTAWKRSHKLIDDVYICEKTGRAHVCGDGCREAIPNGNNDTYVCTVSGRCFGPLLVMEEEEEEELECATRFARAYALGYNCVDDRELKAVRCRC